MGAVEDSVRRALSGADVSREGWEAGWHQEGHSAPPVDENQLALFNLLDLLGRQRRTIPLLAVDANLSQEIDAELDRAAKARSGQLEAAVFGPTVTTPEAVLGDLAEALTAHRQMIMRVASVHLDSTDELETLFARAPIPNARTGPDLLAHVRSAADINSEALLSVARAIDEAN